MKLLSNIFALLFSLALLAALGIGAYFAVKFGARLFAGTGFQLDTATAVVLAAALLVAMLIASSLRRKNQRDSSQQLRPEKLAVYQHRIDAFGEALQQAIGTDNADSNNPAKRFQMLEQRLILIGSPSVIRAYTKLRVVEKEGGPQNSKFSSQLARLLKEMRKDIGMSIHDIAEEEVLHLLLDDSGKKDGSATAKLPLDYKPHVSIAPSS